MNKKFITRGNIDTYTNRFTLYHLTTKTIYLEGGLGNIILYEGFRDYSVNALVDLICGRRSFVQRAKVRFVLRNNPIHTSWAHRFFYDTDNMWWAYNAVVDFKKEIKKIRHELIDMYIL